MNPDTDSGSEFGNEFAEPVANDVVIDTRLADTLEWIAKSASRYAFRAEDTELDGIGDRPDLRYVIERAAAAGEISAEHVAAALADTLQAICVVAGDKSLAEFSLAEFSLAEFLRDWVGTTFASVVRLDSPVRALPPSEARFPRFETEPADESVEVIEVRVTADAAQRVGSLIHNLRREPVGVTANGSADDGGVLAEEWTIGAALNAVTDGWEDAEFVSGQEVALLISLPILVITELFDWLDARVCGGLSLSALEFLKAELVPSLLEHFSDEQREAA